MNKVSLKVILSFITLMSMSLLISAAAFFNPATMPNATLASYAVSTTNLEFVNVAFAYRPWYENGAWQGDLIQYDLLGNGSISTSVDLSTNPPGNTLNANGRVNWSARLQFDINAKNNTARQIITTNGAGVNVNQIPFVWSRLNLAQQNSLDLTPVANNKSVILDYIRGDRSNEVPGGLLRKRYSIMGDIIHTDPVFVGNPNSRIFDPGYALFKSQNLLREPRVYAGANGGMLHVFDALTGDEVYAYIPSMLIKKLNLLTKLPYLHQYYVDGALSAGDMDFGGQNWHSLLVGSLGAGGKGLFALDITDPNLTNQKVLWELDETNPDIGFIYDKSEIVRLPDGNWYVVTGNGYGSTSDVASLLLISSSGVVTTIEADNTIPGNGLSRPTLIDTNGDGAVDFAYAGDLKGNLYRFDLITKLKASKLFSAGNDKPITTAPKITNHPIGGRVVMFGTGSLLSDRDIKGAPRQSIYAIRDFDTARLINPVNLIVRTLSATIAYTNPNTGQITTLRTIKKNNSNPPILDWTTKDGWQIDLPVDERVILDPNLRAARFQVMSTNPVLNEAWLIQLDFYDGTIQKVFYDLNNDLIFDTADTVNFPVNLTGNQTGPGDYPVAIKQGTGSFSRQLISRIINGVDANFVNGLSLPVIDPPLTGKVADGFMLGHIDVDTDSPFGGRMASTLADQVCYEKGNRAADVKIDAAGALIPPSTNSPFRRIGTGTGDGLAGRTDGHMHEYDKAHGTVEVDYIDLELHCNQNRADNTGTARVKLNRVSEVAMGNTREFFVIVANADLSPGSEINVGTESWNVVEYQKLIQQKLDAWIAAGAVAANFSSMMMDQGKSLIYTFDKIITTVNAGTGKFSNSFNNRAIIDGGLHPTQTSCVRSSLQITNNRWRNGALTTQLIDVASYIGDQSTVVKQAPTDLPNSIIINNGNTIDLNVSGATYGGSHANNNYTLPTGAAAKNPAFLYESTLFWHFGNLSSLINNTKPCYGEAGYNVAKATELAGLTQAEFTTLLNDPTNKLGKANLDLLNAIANGATQTVINDFQKAYTKELNKITDYVHKPGSGNPNAPNQPYTVTPTLTLDRSQSNRVASRNSTMGRRTWIDIKP